MRVIATNLSILLQLLCLWLTEGWLANKQQTQLTLDSGKEISIRSRLVPITETWNVTVFELAEPAQVMSHYWSVHQTSRPTLDPFGLVSWPGAVVAAQEMLRIQSHIEGSTILVLGAGPGVEAQAAALLGAKRVIATDVHPTTLQLLRYGAQQAGLQCRIEEQEFDLCSEKPLPEGCDIMLVADVLYNEQLASFVGKRCREAIECGMSILVADSQRLADFVPALNGQLGTEFAWEARHLRRFTGSGVMINEDQTYDIKARVLKAGWLQ